MTLFSVEGKCAGRSVSYSSVLMNGLSISISLMSSLHSALRSVFEFLFGNKASNEYYFPWEVPNIFGEMRAGLISIFCVLNVLVPFLMRLQSVFPEKLGFRGRYFHWNKTDLSYFQWVFRL